MPIESKRARRCPGRALPWAAGLALLLGLGAPRPAAAQGVAIERFNFGIVAPPAEGWNILPADRFPVPELAFAANSKDQSKYLSVRVIRSPVEGPEGQRAFVEDFKRGAAGVGYAFVKEEAAMLGGVVPAWKLVSVGKVSGVDVSEVTCLVFAGGAVYNLNGGTAERYPEQDADLSAFFHSFRFLSPPTPPASIEGLAPREPEILLGDSLGPVLINLFCGLIATGLTMVFAARLERLLAGLFLGLVNLVAGLLLGWPGALAALAASVAALRAAPGDEGTRRVTLWSGVLCLPLAAAILGAWHLWLR